MYQLHRIATINFSRMIEVLGASRWGTQQNLERCNELEDVKWWHMFTRVCVSYSTKRITPVFAWNMYVANIELNNKAKNKKYININFCHLFFRPLFKQKLWRSLKVSPGNFRVRLLVTLPTMVMSDSNGICREEFFVRFSLPVFGEHIFWNWVLSNWFNDLEWQWLEMAWRGDIVNIVSICKIVKVALLRIPYTNILSTNARNREWKLISPPAEAFVAFLVFPLRRQERDFLPVILFLV